MKNRKEEKQNDKEALDFIISNIFDKAKSEHLSKLQTAEDFTKKSEKRYVAKKYNLTKFELKNTIGYCENYTADLIVTLVKTDSAEKYISFTDYWENTAKKITNNKTTIGEKVLLTTELFRNLWEFYGKNLLNEDLLKTTNSLKEIVARLIKFNQNNVEHNLTKIRLSNGQNIFVTNFYEEMFANKNNIIQLSAHESENGFDKTALEIKANVRLQYA